VARFFLDTVYLEQYCKKLDNFLNSVARLISTAKQQIAQLSSNFCRKLIANDDERTMTMVTMTTDDGDD